MLAAKMKFEIIKIKDDAQYLEDARTNLRKQKDKEKAKINYKKVIDESLEPAYIMTALYESLPVWNDLIDKEQITNLKKRYNDFSKREAWLYDKFTQFESRIYRLVLLKISGRSPNILKESKLTDEEKCILRKNQEMFLKVEERKRKATERKKKR